MLKYLLDNQETEMTTSDSDLVRVGMTLTQRDVANAERLCLRFGMRNRAQAVSFAQSLSVSLLNHIASGEEFFVRDKATGALQRLVIIGLPR